ncbi:MAG: tetratricopeptide repeat protein [Saprospiraceae bacterium]|nr:tetratricopeptide repeat protein [Saprospiraceae bacterium]
MMFKLKLIIFFLSSVSIFLSGQVDNRKTEKEIKVEDRFMAAKFQLLSGKTDLALKMLDTLRKENRDNASITFEIAKIHAAKGDIAQAEEYAIQTLKLDSKNDWYKIFYAKLMTEYGKTDEAINTYKSLSVLSPKNTEYYHKIADLNIQKGDYQAALQAMTELEINDGFSEAVVFRKAEILDMSGNVKDAIAEVNRLVSKYPGKVKYLKIITGMLRANGMDNEALPYFRKIIEMEPSDPDATMALLSESASKNNPVTYVQSMLPLIMNPSVPADSKVKELLPFVIIHAETEDTLLGESLKTVCEQLVNTHPSDAKAHAIYGDVLMNAGEITAAVRQYERTVEINDRNFMVWEQWMYGLQTLEQYGRLKEVAADAIDLFPNQAMAYYFAGVADTEKGLLKNAADYLSECEMIAAGDKNVLSKTSAAKGVVHLKNKKYSDAHQAVEKSLDFSEGKNLNAIEISGDIFFAENNKTQAAAKWKEALSKGSKSPSLKRKIDSLKTN